jgi:hypothetical protein
MILIIKASNIVKKFYDFTAKKARKFKGAGIENQKNK